MILLSLWAVSSLLLSVGTLLLGHGMQLTLLPLMAEAAGWPAVLNALTTSAYFLGFAAGCLVVPAGLQRIGHIRMFAVLVAAATAALLALGLWRAPWVWLVLRALYGVAIAGIYLVVESWLNAETTNEYRGAVLAVYAFVTLIAIFGAQFLLDPAASDHGDLVMLAAIFLALAAIPIGLTRRQAPGLVATPRLRLATLLNPANLPALAAGVLTGTFWALGPVFISRLGFAGNVVVDFMAAALGGGMLAVYPLGWLSDRIGRGRVLAALGGWGFTVTLALLLLAPTTAPWVVLYGFGFGAAVMPLYPLCMALANDQARTGNFVESGSVVLMINAIGMMLGPAFAGIVLTGAEPALLLWFWLAAFALQSIVCVRVRPLPAPTRDPATAFELVPRTAQAVLDLDPRAAEPE